MIILFKVNEDRYQIKWSKISHSIYTKNKKVKSKKQTMIVEKCTAYYYL